MSAHPRVAGRCSLADYAALLRLVVDEAGTAFELAVRFGMGVDAVSAVLRRMTGMGLLNVCAWRRTDHGVFATWQPVFGFFGPPAPRPPGARDICVPGQRRDLDQFVRMVQATQISSATVVELAEWSGLSQGRARPLLRAMADELRLLYVSGWHRATPTSWPPMPAYSFGIDVRSRARPTAQALRAIFDKARQQRRRRRLSIEMTFLTAGKTYPPSIR